MKMDELDNILLYDKKVEPSPSFTRHVMARVEFEPAVHRSLPFPWVPFSAWILVVGFFAFWFFPADSFIAETQAAIQAVGSWISTPEDTGTKNAIQYLFFSLTGSLILIWLTLRWANDNS